MRDYKNVEGLRVKTLNSGGKRIVCAYNTIFISYETMSIYSYRAAIKNVIPIIKPVPDVKY